MNALGDALKTVAAAFSIIALVFGGAYAIAGDTIIVATRAWVVAQQQPLAQGQKDIARSITAFSIDQEAGKREAAERERDRLELDALKASDEAERLKVLQLKRRADETIFKINEKIKLLEASK